MKKNPNVDYTEIDDAKGITVSILLNNIGYGVASNIKFYNLLNGKQVHGAQSTSEDNNQKLFTTLDMEASEEKSIQARLISFIEEDEDGIEVDDHIRMLCIYKDLHGNIYYFMLRINYKNKRNYDFCAYQPDSHSNSKRKKENKKEYKRILKDYNETR